MIGARAHAPRRFSSPHFARRIAHSGGDRPILGPIPVGVSRVPGHEEEIKYKCVRGDARFGV